MAQSVTSPRLVCALMRMLANDELSDAFFSPRCSTPTQMNAAMAAAAAPTAMTGQMLFLRRDDNGITPPAAVNVADVAEAESESYSSKTSRSSMATSFID